MQAPWSAANAAADESAVAKTAIACVVGSFTVPSWRRLLGRGGLIEYDAPGGKRFEAISFWDNRPLMRSLFSAFLALHAVGGFGRAARSTRPIERHALDAADCRLS